MNRSEIALRLEEERRRIGVSKARFARELGVSRESLRLYENGQRFMTVDTLVRAASCGIDPQYILMGVRTTSAEQAPAAAERAQGCSLDALIGGIVRDHLEQWLDDRLLPRLVGNNCPVGFTQQVAAPENAEVYASQ